MVEFRKYEKIKRIGVEENQDIFKDENDIILIEEKVDGANTSFFIKNGNIIFGSRNQQITSNEGEDTNINKAFKKSVEYVRELLKDKDLTLLDGLIVYGETMVKHTLSYDFENTPHFIAFDIFDVDTGKYLLFHEKVKIFEILDLPTIPLIFIGNGKELRNTTCEELENLFIKQSTYAPKHNPFKAEGIVIKNYNKQIFAKLVREEFKEANKEVFGGSKKDAKNDDEVIIASYCKNPRIEKQIFKLIDEYGMQLDMSMMKKLPMMVWEDIIEEEGKTILMSKYKLDIGNIRKLVAKRCVNVLQQMIAINMR